MKIERFQALCLGIKLVLGDHQRYFSKNRMRSQLHKAQNHFRGMFTTNRTDTLDTVIIDVGFFSLSLDRTGH